MRGTSKAHTTRPIYVVVLHEYHIRRERSSISSRRSTRHRDTPSLGGHTRRPDTASRNRDCRGPNTTIASADTSVRHTQMERSALDVDVDYRSGFSKYPIWLESIIVSLANGEFREPVLPCFSMFNLVSQTIAATHPPSRHHPTRSCLIATAFRAWLVGREICS